MAPPAFSWESETSPLIGLSYSDFSHHSSVTYQIWFYASSSTSYLVWFLCRLILPKIWAKGFPPLQWFIWQTEFEPLKMFIFKRQDLGLQCQIPLTHLKLWCWSLNCKLRLWVKFQTSSTPPYDRFWWGLFFLLFLLLLLLLWHVENKVNS